MNRFPHLAQRLFNVPIAIHPQKAEVIVAAVADRLGIAHVFRPGALRAAGAGAFIDDDEDDFSQQAEERPYKVVGGVAVIPIRGTLVHKLGMLRPYSGMTGYDGIRLNLLAAQEDAAVKGIELDLDSCGGEVSGLFDLVDMVYGMSARRGGKKPIWAILDDRAYSAAYAIASAADRITVPRTGGVASIGTIVIHSEFAEALKQDGIAVTIIRSDELKAEGNPYEALSADARDRIQAEIDDLNDLFVRTVARNRGLDEKAVRATRAGVFTGPSALARAVSLGFADEVASPDAAFTALLRSL
jgi:ClpP class serine protease